MYSYSAGQSNAPSDSNKTEPTARVPRLRTNFLDRKEDIRLELKKKAKYFLAEKAIWERDAIWKVNTNKTDREDRFSVLQVSSFFTPFVVCLFVFFYMFF